MFLSDRDDNKVTMEEAEEKLFQLVEAKQLDHLLQHFEDVGTVESIKFTQEIKTIWKSVQPTIDNAANVVKWAICQSNVEKYSPDLHSIW